MRPVANSRLIAVLIRETRLRTRFSLIPRGFALARSVDVTWLPFVLFNDIGDIEKLVPAGFAAPTTA